MKRNTLILAGILVLLVAGVILVLQKPGEISTTGANGEVLVTYDSAAVDGIEISSAGGRVILEKQGTSWMLTEPVRAIADEGVVTSTIGSGKAIALKGVVSSNPAKQALFQVDSTGTLVKFSGKGALLAAFRLGKTGPAYTETYVRRENSNEVFLAEGMPGYMFTRQTRDWRDKTIFKTPLETVTSVQFRYGDTTFTLARQDSLWRLDGSPAAGDQVRSFLGSLTNFLADDFVDSTLTVTPPLIAVVEVHGVQIRFHKNSPGTTYVVTTSRTPQVFSVQEWKAGQVLKRRDQFMKPL
jgi:hypothetical protein